MGLFRWPRPPWSITGFCERWQPGKARPVAVGYRNITTRGPHARVSARDASASPFRYYRCGLAQNPSSTHDIWQRAWCATFALSYSKQVAGVAISSRPHRCLRSGRSSNASEKSGTGTPPQICAFKQVARTQG